MANNVIKRTWNQNKMVCIEDLSGMAFQSESGGHTFEISGTNDSGTSVSLSGTVEARFLRADNVKVTIAGTISSGKASVTLTSNCYTVAGRFSLTIFVTSDSQKVAVYSAVGNVAVTDGVSSGTVPPLVTDNIQTGSMTASGDVTVNGVLDVTSRRCYAALSSAGWYRVMKMTGSNTGEAAGAGGFVVDFNIVRNVDTANNEAHKISLMATWNNVKFVNEQSVSNTLGITKIRTTNIGSNLYVDVYYGLSTQNTVTVAFDVTCRGGDQSKFNSQPFTSIAASPSGETVLTEYTFAANSESGRSFYAGSFSGSSDAEIIKQACEAVRTQFSNDIGKDNNAPFSISFFRQGAWEFIGTGWIRNSEVYLSVGSFGAGRDVLVYQASSGATPTIKTITYQ